MPPPPPPSPLPPPPPLQPGKDWGPFYVLVKETFDSTRNCLVDCDANPITSSYPEIQTTDNKGSIAVGHFAPEGSPPNAPQTEVVVLTNGFEYKYSTPPPARAVFTPVTMGLSLPEEVHLMTAVKIVDVDGDGLQDVITTFADGTTRIVGSNPTTRTEIPPITVPMATTDVAVADVNSDGWPDIVTVNDAGENVLYLGPITFTTPFQNQGKILGTAARPKRRHWQRSSSAPAAPQGEPGGSGRLGASGVEARPLGAPTTALGARASRLQSHRFCCV